MSRADPSRVLGDVDPTSWLHLAEELIAIALQAQADGDTLRSLTAALHAGQCLTIHGNLDDARRMLEAPR